MAHARRPLLAPGLEVLDRGAGEIQVGLDPDTAVVFADTPGHRAALRALASGALVVDNRGEEPDRAARTRTGDDAVLEVLAREHLLVEQSDLFPLVRISPAPPVPRNDAAAAARVGPEDVGPRLRRRGDATVRVLGFGDHDGPDAGPKLTEEAVRVLGRGGLRSRPVERGETGAGCDLVLVVGAGEPVRECLDPLLRSGTAYLLVRLGAGATVGPLVVPGTTACLRCLDAHHTDADPSWPLLVAQHAGLCATDRRDGVPEPVDSWLASLALAWAARDAATWVEGSRPSTWSATTTLRPRLDSLETRSWLRHPGCGCGWDLARAAGPTPDAEPARSYPE